jgi:catechol 2,3-dioxygenase-like lactoylglutathione lyase family enzyme
VLTNPDHVTVAVRDLDAALEFFALLGFEKDHVAIIDGGVPAAYMGMPDMKADHVTLVLKGAEPRFEIQLLHFADGSPSPSDESASTSGDPAPTRLRQVGFNHVAFRVDDLAKSAAVLTENGVEQLNDAMDFIGRRLQFFAGPEGVTIELVEWLDEEPPAE